MGRRAAIIAQALNLMPHQSMLTMCSSFLFSNEGLQFNECNILQCNADNIRLLTVLGQFLTLVLPDTRKAGRIVKSLLAVAKSQCKLGIRSEQKWQIVATVTTTTTTALAPAAAAAAAETLSVPVELLDEDMLDRQASLELMPLRILMCGCSTTWSARNGLQKRAAHVTNQDFPFPFGLRGQIH